MGGKVGKTIKRGVTAGLTGGLSEFRHGTDAFGVQRGLNAFMGNSGSSGGGGAGPSNVNPAQLLAQSGGAPLLANIAMGANVDDSIAGYFGHGNFKQFYEGLSPQDRSLVDGVRNQLSSIQQNTNLRNQAVKQIVDDFPNIAKQATEARLRSGQEFDEVTKSVLDQASNQLAAKYASTGGFSSGAFNQGLAQKAGDIALNKLSYMDQRGQEEYGRGLDQWNARYSEANALRGFQQTMLGQGVQQGFSANQAALERNQQNNLAAMQFQQQNDAAKMQERGQLFGALGTLGGAVLGGPIGGYIGNSIFGGGNSPRLAARPAPYRSYSSSNNAYGGYGA